MELNSLLELSRAEEVLNHLDLLVLGTSLLRMRNIGRPFCVIQIKGSNLLEGILRSRSSVCRDT